MSLLVNSMKSPYMRLIIQAFVLTLFGIGTSLAAGNLCLPGCSNCKPVTAMSCCDGMTADTDPVNAAQSEHRTPSNKCSHCEICLEEVEQTDELIVQPIPSIEICGPQVELILSANLLERTSLPDSLAPSFLFGPSPALYISNCSFLI